MAESCAGERVRWLLLAGGLKASPLASEVGCSVLDLRITPGKTALDHWMEMIAAGAAACPVESVTIVNGGQAFVPEVRAETRSFGVDIVTEPRSLRGPAGIVRDVCADWGADQLVVVSEAKRCMTGGAAAMVREHLATSAAITVAANADGTPAGLYLFRRSALDTVSSAGFMDLKEQWIRRAQERKADVRVHRLAGWGSMPLRTREQFLTAAMAMGGVRPEGRLTRFSLFDPASAISVVPFNVLGPGAVIGAGATVLDSIVMDGAEIGAGAVVVRSIVAGGVAVQPGSEVVDAIVTVRGVVSESPGGRKGSEKKAVRA